MRKRILALVLALVMCLTLIPMGAMAADYSVIPEDAVEFDGHYYKLFDVGYVWNDAEAYCESVGGYSKICSHGSPMLMPITLTIHLRICQLVKEGLVKKSGGIL